MDYPKYLLTVVACLTLATGLISGKVVVNPRSIPGITTASRPLSNFPNRILFGTHQNAGFIPNEIGEQMLGRSFQDFDDFRMAFWQAMRRSRYAKEFFYHPANAQRMASGLAPIVRREQNTFQAYEVYHLHHLIPIQHGGGVYDLSNIAIMTPLAHSESLDPTYHYGL